jgi:hypothetical protein
MRLERAPALEAIRLGYGELRLVQSRIRLRGAQRAMSRSMLSKKSVASAVGAWLFV